MADLTTLRTSLAAVWASIPGLRVHPKGLWPDSINPPALLLKPSRRRPQVLDRSTQAYEFDLILAAQLATMAAAQTVIDPYVSDSGAQSIEATLFASALGSSVLACDLEQYGGIKVNGIDYLGAQWRLEVLA